METEVFDGGTGLVDDDACVLYEDVEAAEGGGEVGDGGVDGGGDGEVEFDDGDGGEEGGAVIGVDLGEGGFSFGRGAGAEEEVVVGGGFGEGDDGLEADAAVGAWGLLVVFLGRWGGRGNLPVMRTMVLSVDILMVVVDGDFRV